MACLDLMESAEPAMQNSTPERYFSAIGACLGMAGRSLITHHMNRSTPLALFLAAVVCCIPACKTSKSKSAADRFLGTEDSGPVRVLSLKQLPGLPADVRLAAGKSFNIREPFLFDTDSGVGYFQLEVKAGRRVQV